MLAKVDVVVVPKPVYLEASFTVDDRIIQQVKSSIIDGNQPQVIIEGDAFKLITVIKQSVDKQR
jgi:hypothetical protein